MTGRKHLLCLYPWMEVGGADKFNVDMLGCLRARGWTATVVTTLPSRHPWKTQFEKVADDLVDLAQFPPEERPQKLAEIIRQRAPDVLLLSHSSAGYRLLPYLRAQLPGLPLADYCHMEELNWGNGGFPRLSADHTRLLDLQIVSSQHLRDWISQRGGELDRLMVSTTNIDPTDWDPAKHDRAQLRASLGIPPNAAVALYAGRLVRQKQPILAVDVMRQILQELPQTVFLIAGDGVYAGYLRAYVRHHRLENHVRLLGSVSNQQMRNLLAASDVFFLPSEMEGISLAIFEAMAMGVVPVSADVGGQAELVTPDCGILVTRGPNEGPAYRQALADLLRHRDRLKAMGMAARKRVQDHFRLEQMGAQMESALERAIEFHHARPRPAVSADDAEASARLAIDAARQSETHRRDASDQRPTWRQKLRRTYWHCVEKGAWRLVPWVEKAGDVLGRR